MAAVVAADGDHGLAVPGQVVQIPNAQAAVTGKLRHLLVGLAEDDDGQLLAAVVFPDLPHVGLEQCGVGQPVRQQFGVGVGAARLLAVKIGGAVHLDLDGLAQVVVPLPGAAAGEVDRRRLRQRGGRQEGGRGDDDGCGFHGALAVCER